MYNKLSGVLNPVIFALSALFLLAGCGSESSVKNAEETARPAKMMTIGLTTDSNLLNYPAIIKSQQLSTLSFEVSGVVQKILIVEAQEVNKGDVLAQLDDQDLQNKLEPARAQFENADAEYQRAVRLLKEDAISRSEVEQRKSTRDVNRAQFEAAEKALRDSLLIAPFSGNIAKVSIQKKQAVQAGEEAILILGSGGLEASINLPSSIIALAKDRDEPSDPVYLTLSVASGLKIPVKFKEASLSADAASQTYEVTFTFSAPEGLNILPGMNATIWFKDPRKTVSSSSEVRIPLTAILSDGKQKSVWIVNEDSMSVSRRNITIKDDIGTDLIVSSGLELGETIIVAGVHSLSEGMSVRPWKK